jgi:hypothetical protein
METEALRKGRRAGAFAKQTEPPGGAQSQLSIESPRMPAMLQPAKKGEPKLSLSFAVQAHFVNRPVLFLPAA